MKSFLKGFLSAVIAGTILIGLFFVLSHASQSSSGARQTMGSLLQAADVVQPKVLEKSPEERRADALQRSSDVKGLYMTADVANDQGAEAVRLRNHIIGLAKTTEINGVVIDVKEVCGPDYNPAHLKALLDGLHRDHIWAIARIVTLKDASQINAHPEWYLKRKTQKKVSDQCADKKYLRVAGTPMSVGGMAGQAVNFWQDNKGGYWLDAASQGAREYLVSFAKKMIDLGFDELQFDYVRFPSDGDVDKAIYPAWNHKTPKYEVMKSFFSYLGTNLRTYKPDIILSADLFGYAALQYGDVGIGQRLQDIGESFDYVSFMVYPSHYYEGLYLEPNALRNFPAVALDAKGVRLHPDITVGRSLQAARDFLDGSQTTTIAIAPTSSTSSPQNPGTSTSINADLKVAEARSHLRLRPWLEDFFHEQDKVSHRPYGVQKVRMEIDAAEHVEQHGWLLWNASNVYSEGALKKGK